MTNPTYNANMINSNINIFSDVYNKYPALVSNIKNTISIIDELNEQYQHQLSEHEEENKDNIEESQQNVIEQIVNETVEESMDNPTDTSIESVESLEFKIRSELDNLKLKLENTYLNIPSILEILSDDIINNTEKYYNRKLYKLRLEYNDFIVKLKTDNVLSSINWSELPIVFSLENNADYKFINDKLNSIKLIKFIKQNVY